MLRRDPQADDAMWTMQRQCSVWICHTGEETEGVEEKATQHKQHLSQKLYHTIRWWCSNSKERGSGWCEWLKIFFCPQQDDICTWRICGICCLTFCWSFCLCQIFFVIFFCVNFFCAIFFFIFLFFCVNFFLVDEFFFVKNDEMKKKRPEATSFTTILDMAREYYRLLWIHKWAHNTVRLWLGVSGDLGHQKEVLRTKLVQTRHIIICQKWYIMGYSKGIACCK